MATMTTLRGRTKVGLYKTLNTDAERTRTALYALHVTPDHINASLTHIV